MYSVWAELTLNVMACQYFDCPGPIPKIGWATKAITSACMILSRPVRRVSWKSVHSHTSAVVVDGWDQHVEQQRYQDHRRTDGSVSGPPVPHEVAAHDRYRTKTPPQSTTGKTQQALESERHGQSHEETPDERRRVPARRTRR